jgi:hypothetical protein
MTLTEFNRYTSRATRLARDEAVTITERGVPTLELRSIAPQESRLDAMMREGGAVPATRRSTAPLPVAHIDRATARHMIEEFERDRNDREY